MKRTIKISIELDPPISGYAGYDEWEVEYADNDTQDEILNKINELVVDTSNKYDLNGGYTGLN